MLVSILILYRYLSTLSIVRLVHHVNVFAFSIHNRAKFDSNLFHVGKIKLVPGVGTVFGGTAVRVSGTCAQDPQNIKCSFGHQIVNGRYLQTEYQFLCVSPEFQDRKVGRIPFSLTFNDGGKTVTVRSSFYKSEAYFLVHLCKI